MAAAVNPASNGSPRPNPQIQPCRYKVGKTLGAGSYSVVKECVHIDTGRYYAAKVINKRLMAGREHMVRTPFSYIPSLVIPRVLYVALKYQVVRVAKLTILSI